MDINNFLNPVELTKEEEQNFFASAVPTYVAELQNRVSALEEKVEKLEFENQPDYSNYVENPDGSIELFIPGTYTDPKTGEIFEIGNVIEVCNQD